jgi:site-specific DNA-methyltransferase (adenine-specific)
MTMIELNRIYNEDCLEGMKRIQDGSIDLVCTDIPYGVCNRNDNGLRNLDKNKADIETFPLADFLMEINRVTKGSVYIFCASEQLSEIRSALVQNGFTTRVCVWEKTNPSPMNGQHVWLSGIELCVYGRKKGATFNEHCKNTVFRHPCGRNKLHPTQKPLELFERFILASTNQGDVVLDPCMGSGTTAIACINTNRNYIGFELDKHYCEIANERIQTALQHRAEVE